MMSEFDVARTMKSEISYIIPKLIPINKSSCGNLIRLFFLKVF